jgi:hypothetical protein
MVSPARQAIEYAEQNLKFNAVWEEALDQELALQSVLADITLVTSNKRTQEDKITNREFEVISEQRAINSGMSQTAFDKHVKKAIWIDSSLQSLRADLISFTNTLLHLEARRHSLDSALRIRAARMTALGGYLQYLAAVKSSTNQLRNEPE